MTSKIEYVDETWNPVTGCTPVSEGCAHCYAKRMAKRLAGRFGYPRDESECPVCHETYDRAKAFCPEHPNPKLIRRSSFDVTVHEDKLERPLRWKKPRRVFVCSMGDLFHEDVPDAYRTDIFDVMTCADQHTFLVLTKRPERINEWENWVCECWPGDSPWNITREVLNAWPPNVWPGVTVCNAEELWKVDVLLRTPAAKHWVSLEPLLEPVNARDYLRGCGFYSSPALDWVVLGGETGPGARPMHPGSARDVRDQCVETGTPFLFKGWGDWFPRDQWRHSPELVLPNDDVAYQEGPRTHVFADGTAAHRIGKKRAGRLLDGETWDQYPG